MKNQFLFIAATSIFICLPMSTVAATTVVRHPTAVANTVKDRVEFESELFHYGELKNKVFLSDSERSEKVRLESHRELLKSLAHLLRRPSIVGSPREVLQNNAIDLLISSLESHPGGGVAADVLTEIVKDPAIEHQWDDVEAERSVAGFKAEILYLWSANKPDQVQAIEALLPGPASKKLWQNVLNAQSENTHAAKVTGF